MRKVAIYSRVSTINQAEEGYSIQGQIEALTKYCEAMEWKIYKNYSDAGFSGGKLERPAITELIEDGKNNKFDTILVYKLDRLSRNVKDTLYLVKDVFTANNIHFVSLKENIDTSSAMGNLFLTLLSAIAEFEREQIKERMQFGVMNRAKSGKTTAWKTPPYGYRYNKDEKTLSVNELEAANVRQMFDMIISGCSIMSITNYARDNFVGNTWTHVKVKRILENETYKGLVKYREQTFSGDHQAIIDEKTYNKAQIALAHTTDTKTNTRPFQGKYMLSHIAKCGYCGAPLKVCTGRAKNDGTRRQTYVCVNKTESLARRSVNNYNNQKICNTGRYEKKHIEKYVIDVLYKLQHDKEYLKKIKKDDNIIDITPLKKEIEIIDKKINRLNDLYINDLIDLPKLKKDIEELNHLKDDYNKAIKLNYLDKKNEDSLGMLMDNLDIRKSSYDVQSRIVKQLIDRVEVTMDNIDIIFKF
ncbi:TPA: recombinase family protein [Streptococcus pyogenes]|nr:recombinase family protein [Streptococcus pyogenes]HER2173029.1 recombinase family protein [Streptococcus pyogenes]